MSPAGQDGVQGPQPNKTRIGSLLRPRGSLPLRPPAPLRVTLAVGGALLATQTAETLSTPGGKAMFQMLGVFAEFERAMIVERVHAGLKRAKAQGKILGRPRVDQGTEKAIRRELAKGTGIRAVARKVGVGVGTVQRVKAEQAA